MDGLKTGFTDNALYCLTATAKKEDMRLITVVMGEPSAALRSSETSSLLDYGFNMYGVNKILDTNTIITKQKVLLGDKEKVGIIPVKDINLLYEKSNGKRNVDIKYNIKDLKAPIKKGDIIGNLDIIENNKKILSVDLTIDKNINKANIIKVYYQVLKDIIKGNIFI